jgi:thymidylate synthase
MGPVLIDAPSLGEGWLQVARAILEQGVIASWGGQATREAALLTLVVERPASSDPTIARLGDPEWLAWMHENFFVQGDVAELGGARSYASRLFDYAGSGHDQLEWVVARLAADPACRDATITTFEPLTDASYVPCVSMLDFWRPDSSVELVVYAHSLDFGKKAYGNLVELAHLQEHVAARLGAPVGRLVLHVKTAHVYDTELELMSGILEPVAGPSFGTVST